MPGTQFRNWICKYGDRHLESTRAPFSALVESNLGDRGTARVSHGHLVAMGVGSISELAGLYLLARWFVASFRNRHRWLGVDRHSG